MRAAYYGYHRLFSFVGVFAASVLLTACIGEDESNKPDTPTNIYLIDGVATKGTLIDARVVASDLNGDLELASTKTNSTGHFSLSNVEHNDTILLTVTTQPNTTQRWCVTHLLAVAMLNLEKASFFMIQNLN